MNIQHFYIIIENRFFRHDKEENDYHIENLFTKEKALNIIKEYDYKVFFQYELIITNDERLLSKYLFAINKDEFKMLCGLKDFKNDKIRINKSFFNNYTETAYKYFSDILENKIVSANMMFDTIKIYPFDSDPTLGLDLKIFRKWVVNKNFKYFETPLRYYNSKEGNTLFSIDDIKETDLKELNEIFNINILEIGFENSDNNLNWEYKKGLLHFFDKISNKHLFLSEKTLKELEKTKNLKTKIKVEIKLNKEHYIEYYLIDNTLFVDPSEYAI